MIAREIFPFNSARLHATSRLPSKSFISPTYDYFTSNSFVSPTYAKTGGVPPTKMSACPERSRGARRHLLSLFSQSPLSVLFTFNHLRTLSFSVSHLSPVPPAASALFHQKTRVYPPPVVPIPTHGTGSTKSRPPQKASTTKPKRARFIVPLHESPVTSVDRQT